MTSTERGAGLGDVSEPGPESAAVPRGGEKEEGLWWAAPPPRGTDKGTLALLRVAYNAVIAAAARCENVDMAEELFKEVSHRQGKETKTGCCLGSCPTSVYFIDPIWTCFF
jgi:pentatricopeptide repeat protein